MEVRFGSYLLSRHYLANLRAQRTSSLCGNLQAVFVVGLEAEGNPAVLDSYAVAVLRRILDGWLAIGPDVRLLLVLPATADCHMRPAPHQADGVLLQS